MTLLSMRRQRNRHFVSPFNGSQPDKGLHFLRSRHDLDAYPSVFPPQQAGTERRLFLHRVSGRTNSFRGKISSHLAALDDVEAEIRLPWVDLGSRGHRFEGPRTANSMSRCCRSGP